MVFCLDDNPLMICTWDWGTLSAFEKSSTSAWLALPLTGGAARRTFKNSPSTPITEVLEAAGTTFTAKLTPRKLEVSLNVMAQKGLALPKDCSAQADYCSTFLNGNRVIMTHSHRQLQHFNVCNGAAPDSFRQFSQSSKIGTRSLRILPVWRDRHEAPNRQMIQRGRLLDQLSDCVFRNSRFGWFQADVDLEQDRHHFVY